MNRLAQIEQALRDLAAAHDDEDWEAMAAVPAFDPGVETGELIDTADASALLAKIEALLSVFTQEAQVVRDELDAQPRVRRAARAYLTADAGAAPGQ